MSDHTTPSASCPTELTSCSNEQFQLDAQLQRLRNDNSRAAAAQQLLYKSISAELEFLRRATSALASAVHNPFAVSIQSCARRWRAKRTAAARGAAVICVQRFVRGMLARINYSRHRNAAPQSRQQACSNGRRQRRGRHNMLSCLITRLLSGAMSPQLEYNIRQHPAITQGQHRAVVSQHQRRPAALCVQRNYRGWKFLYKMQI